MISATVILGVALVIEVVARLVLEIRERRLSQLRGGVFAVLRLVPLVNDIVPLPDAARKAVLEAVSDTAEDTGLVFNIAINYGGRAEIVRAAKQLAQQAKDGSLDPEQITEDLFAEELYTADLPDPDLIIRTGGELRLSNFLTWQSAYSEIYVTDTYWPEFTPEKLMEAIEAYNGRDRRYGGIKA